VGANVGWSYGTGDEYKAIAELLNRASREKLQAFADVIRQGNLGVLEAHEAVFSRKGMKGDLAAFRDEFKDIRENWFGDNPMWFGNSVLTPGQIHEVMRESRARTVELLLAGEPRESMPRDFTTYIGCGYPQFRTIITWDGAVPEDAQVTPDGRPWAPRKRPTGPVTMFVLTPFNTGYADPARSGPGADTEAAQARKDRDELAARIAGQLQPSSGTRDAPAPDHERRRHEALAEIRNVVLVDISHRLPKGECPWRGNVLGLVGDGDPRPGRHGLHITYYPKLVTPPPLPPDVPDMEPYNTYGLKLDRRTGPGIVITWSEARQSGAQDLVQPRASHGSPPRGLRPVDASRRFDGLFGRMFGRLTPASRTERETEELFAEFAALAGRMVVDAEVPAGADDPRENPDIDAIYTYLGQFIDHDISFDPASSLQRTADPDALIDFRTPRFDLDSLYGRGPDDQPYLYDEHHRFVLGPDKTFDARFRPDLPRMRTIALIGDPRNDQNLVLSQLHVAFLRFHNAVIDGLDRGGQRRSFEEAQRTVRWHYQWLIVNDFLRKIVGNELVDDLYGPADQVPSDLAGRLRLYRPRGRWGAFMPVEFSAAAYRFGHSMVRPSYLINDQVLPPEGHERIPLFDRPQSAVRAEDLGNLRGFGEIPDLWAVDWRYFVAGLGDDPGLLAQKSYRIDTRLADPLARIEQVGVVASGDGPSSLAERNLQRGARFNLPSGQAVARYLGVQPLGPSSLGLDDLPRCAADTPLWYYILREAEVEGGRRLGRVGAAIVAEVILGLLAHDQFSYVNQDRTWRPHLGNGSGKFGAADLVRVASSWTRG
jgi:hypothetical protein